MPVSPVYPPLVLKGDWALRAALVQALTASNPQPLRGKGLVLPSKRLATVGGICRARWKKRQVTWASFFLTYMKAPA